MNASLDYGLRRRRKPAGLVLVARLDRHRWYFARRPDGGAWERMPHDPTSKPPLVARSLKAAIQGWDIAIINEVISPDDFDIVRDVPSRRGMRAAMHEGFPDNPDRWCVVSDWCSSWEGTRFMNLQRFLEQEEPELAKPTRSIAPADFFVRHDEVAVEWIDPEVAEKVLAARAELLARQAPAVFDAERDGFAQHHSEATRRRAARSQSSGAQHA